MLKLLRQFFLSPPVNERQGMLDVTHHSREQINALAIETFIGATSVIEGDLIITGGVRIEGSVFGSVEVRGVNACLVIADRAKVFGDLVADHIIVNGTVQGSVEARVSLRLDSNAVVMGDARYRDIDMQIGSEVNGVFHPIIDADVDTSNEARVPASDVP